MRIKNALTLRNMAWMALAGAAWIAAGCADRDIEPARLQAPETMQASLDAAKTSLAGSALPALGSEPRRRLNIGFGHRLDSRSGHGPETLLRQLEPADCRLGVLLSTGAIDLTAETDGRLVEVRVEPGQAVRSGELLAVLENPSLSHRLAQEQSTMDLIRAEVGTFELEVDQAKRARDRIYSLSDLYSRQTLETNDAVVKVAQYRLDVAHAEVGQSNARLADLRDDVKKLEIRAPFDGVVSLRAAEPGAGVRVGTRLFRLLGEGKPQVRFGMPPAEAGGMRPGTPVAVRLDGGENSRPAIIRHVAPEVDGPSDLLFVVADLSDSEGMPAPVGTVVRVSRDPSGGSCPG